MNGLRTAWITPRRTAELAQLARDPIRKRVSMGKFYSPSEWIRRILSRTRGPDGRYLGEHYRDLGERRAIADQAFSLSPRTESNRVAYEEDAKAIRHLAIEIRKT